MALITAMRTWQTIPKALVFDNDSPFKGKLLSTFCNHLGIRLIYASVRHPQTNGKLERAFRDDMNEFYRQQQDWVLESLRRALPEYVHYRNYVRGHRALGGKPSIITTAPFLALEFRKAELDLRFFTTLTSLGTPHDITLQELRIESFFPADEANEEVVRHLARD